MVGIHRFLFPPTEGYEVVQEVRGRPGFCILKLSPTPGGILHESDFLLIERKKVNEPWGATKDQLHENLAENMNETKSCYGMIQIGLVVQFYKYEQGVFEKIGEEMHLITDVQDVIRWARYLKKNPMPVV